jgi:hypothetical protein
MDLQEARLTLAEVAGNYKKMEAGIRKLVANRAWEIMGYTCFSKMWIGEMPDILLAHRRIPAALSALVIEALVQAGGDKVSVTRDLYGSPSGTTYGSVAQAVKQVEHGVPHFAITMDYAKADKTIDKYGKIPLANEDRVKSGPSRQRERARLSLEKHSKGPMDRIEMSFGLPKWQYDVMHDIGVDENISDGAIYRRAVNQYLAGLGKTPPRGLS